MDVSAHESIYLLALDLGRAVETFYFKTLPSNKLERLSEIFPSPEETELVTAYTGNLKALGEVEQFFLAMSKERPAQEIQIVDLS